MSERPARTRRVRLNPDGTTVTYGGIRRGRGRGGAQGLVQNATQQVLQQPVSQTTVSLPTTPISNERDVTSNAPPADASIQSSTQGAGPVQPASGSSHHSSVTDGQVAQMPGEHPSPDDYVPESPSSFPSSPSEEENEQESSNAIRSGETAIPRDAPPPRHASTLANSSISQHYVDNPGDGHDSSDVEEAQAPPGTQSLVATTGFIQRLKITPRTPEEAEIVVEEILKIANRDPETVGALENLNSGRAKGKGKAKMTDQEHDYQQVDEFQHNSTSQSGSIHGELPVATSGAPGTGLEVGDVGDEVMDLDYEDGDQAGLYEDEGMQAQDHAFDEPEPQAHAMPVIHEVSSDDDEDDDENYILADNIKEMLDLEFEDERVELEQLSLENLKTKMQAYRHVRQAAIMDEMHDALNFTSWGLKNKGHHENHPHLRLTVRDMYAWANLRPTTLGNQRTTLKRLNQVISSLTAIQKAANSRMTLEQQEMLEVSRILISPGLSPKAKGGNEGKAVDLTISGLKRSLKAKSLHPDRE
ncbi:hypothetical protein SCHPADRAFT_945143 [Schizopora paradoxa]|uniref:Uncharacterized protein n=1 Tax=Schizopora paradoxa TaxID=27342 RepID=A0A0H2RS16_9AGAM|nr:hypothetical protein SCHPADRAFT_945143 [Schizopora paradoxa]